LSALEVVALGNGTEDTDSYSGDDESADDSLNEDGILDLAESRFLDPDFAVEDLADNVALLVPGDPWLVFPGVT
jgi:hypothetical protein